MALDSLTVLTLTSYLNHKLKDGRITKIGHPEKDEVYFTVRSNNNNYKLIISANSQYPLIYIDNDYKKENPKTASNYCMILRKYLLNSKIENIIQINDDRIIEFHISHYDELGDLNNYKLIIELMGKHSNIILVNENNRILDSIKHIDASTSSVRQVFPGSNYFIVNERNKISIFDTDFDKFRDIFASSEKISNLLSNNIQFIPPKFSQEICYKAKVDSDLPSNQIDDSSKLIIYNIIIMELKRIMSEQFDFRLYYENDKPIEYSIIPYLIYNKKNEKYNDINSLLIDFYRKSLDYTHIYEKTYRIRTVINQNIKRLSKKLNIWNMQLNSCNDKDKFKLYGELLFANMYKIKNDMTAVEVENYYNNEVIKIKLDNMLTPSQNAQFYYDKYNKLKRTEVVTKKLIECASEELDYLSTIAESVKHIQNNKDINDILQELTINGYIKSKDSKKKNIKLTKVQPLHYTDSEGFEYYVGKNNLQNEEVTFKIAESNDWWFHIKNKPGSHVIVKSKPNTDLPDEVFIRAAALAGFYSSENNSDKVEIDYIQRKFLKKPKNYKIGMVIYHTNYSINVTPSTEGLRLLNK